MDELTAVNNLHWYTNNERASINNQRVEMQRRINEERMYESQYTYAEYATEDELRRVAARIITLEGVVYTLEARIKILEDELKELKQTQWFTYVKLENDW